MKQSVWSNQFMTNLCDKQILQEWSSKINFFSEKDGQSEKLAAGLSIIFFLYEDHNIK